MQIIEKKIMDIREYENNPRKNDNAVQYVAESIKNFGWQQPIVIDNDGVIVAGHTRFKAAQSLGMDKVPCVIASELNEEQIRAFRIADNRTAEYAEWDMDKLKAELDEIENYEFDFDFVDDSEVVMSKKELKPYEKVHYLLTIDINDHDKIIPIIEKIKELGGIQIETSIN